MDRWMAFGSFIARHMIVIVPACLVCGICFPWLFQGFVPFVSPIFAFITFQGSLTNDFSNLKNTFTHPLPMFVAIGISQLAMPLLAWLVGSLFFSDPNVVCGIVLEYCVPIAVTSTMWVSIYAGDMALTLGILLISTCIAPFTIPATLQLLLGATVTVDARAMILQMLFMVAIPALLATWLNDHTKGAARTYLSPRLMPAARILTVLVITTNSTSLSTFFFNLTPELIGILFFIAAMAASGYLWGYLAAGALHVRRAQAVSIIFCSALRNIAAGAIIAQTYFPPITVFPVQTGTLFNQFFAALFGKLLGPHFEQMQVAEVREAAAQHEATRR